MCSNAECVAFLVVCALAVVFVLGLAVVVTGLVTWVI